MRVKLLTAGLLAVTGLLAGSASSRAGDLFRLAIPAGDNTPTMKLGEAGTDADTLDVWFRGGFHGGFRGGFYGGYRGFYGGGFRGFGGYGGGYGYRSFYGGYGGFGGYRPFYGSSFAYRPYYWGGCGYYGYPSYWYGNYGFCPIGGASPALASTTFSLELGSGGLEAQLQPVPAPSVQPVPNGSAPSPAPSTPARPAPNEGTFEYDGGPRTPVPIPRGEPSAPPAPRTDPAPMNLQPAVPLEGRPVSIQTQTTVRTGPRYTYPAYGEQPRTATDGSRQAKR